MTRALDLDGLADAIERVEVCGAAADWFDSADPIQDHLHGRTVVLVADLRLLIAAARERDGLIEQARLDGEALKAADVALANVTAFEDDARYIMGNTNFEITRHCRDEIKSRLEARHALTNKADGEER